MFLVDGPVHAHRGLQPLQLPVGADAVGDGCQCGGAETGGAGGDGVAAHAHDAGVHLVPVQTQAGEDGLSVLQTVLLAGRQQQ